MPINYAEVEELEQKIFQVLGRWYSIDNSARSVPGFREGDKVKVMLREEDNTAFSWFVRANEDLFRETGIVEDPNLAGRVEVVFRLNGAVS